jgi:uncharacterized damage-inducible protein DinB
MKSSIPVSILDRLKTQHLTLADIISRLNIKQIINKPVPEKWGIHENMAHLVKYQKLFIDRVDKILTSDTPIFEPYRAEIDFEFDTFVQKSPDNLLSEINADRRILTLRIECLTENDLQRVGIHTTYGKMNLLDWLEFFLLHESHHLFTIFKLVHKE